MMVDWSSKNRITPSLCILPQILPVLVCSLLVSACASRPHTPNYVAQSAVWKAESDSKMTDIRAAQLPTNYKKIIDARFERTLVDPDSRKIEYTKNPGGGIVCGTVNAKNRLGGYTGRQSFVVAFNSTGTIQHAEIYPDETYRSLLYNNDRYLPFDRALATSCGP